MSLCENITDGEKRRHSIEERIEGRASADILVFRCSVE